MTSLIGRKPARFQENRVSAQDELRTQASYMEYLKSKGLKLCQKNKDLIFQNHTQFFYQSQKKSAKFHDIRMSRSGRIYLNVICQS